MKFAFVLYHYYPYGGLQRDFRSIVEACLARNHQVDLYCCEWEGPEIPGAELYLKSPRGRSRHRRYQRFQVWLEDQLKSRPHDAVVGFNKMPGLDVYFSGEGCYLESATRLHGPLYRFTPGFKHYCEYEKAVFNPAARVDILLSSTQDKSDYIHHYHTPEKRFHSLSPGIRLKAQDEATASNLRQRQRNIWGIPQDHYVVVMISSHFKTKGLDRALLALGSLPKTLKHKTHFVVMGQDDPKPYKKLISAQQLVHPVLFLKAREDIAPALYAGDILIYPAYRETSGPILLEAMVTGLPVLTTQACGYAHFVEKAGAGYVVPTTNTQQHLNEMLARMLLSTQKHRWKENALAFTASTDLYQMPEHAVDKIEAKATRKRQRQGR